MNRLELSTYFDHNLRFDCVIVLSFNPNESITMVIIKLFY